MVIFRTDLGRHDDEGGGCFDLYCSGFDGAVSRLRMIFRGDSVIHCYQYSLTRMFAWVVRSVFSVYVDVLETEGGSKG